ncbi:MAG: hypothetical protein IJA72_04870 [Clostridia bacterium]|nr:hypothetical protein [Clostridia bacterium]
MSKKQNTKLGNTFTSSSLEKKKQAEQKKQIEREKKLVPVVSSSALVVAFENSYLYAQRNNVNALSYFIENNGNYCLMFKRTADNSYSCYIEHTSNPTSSSGHILLSAIGNSVDEALTALEYLLMQASADMNVLNNKKLNRPNNLIPYKLRPSYDSIEIDARLSEDNTPKTFVDDLVAQGSIISIQRNPRKEFSETYGDVESLFLFSMPRRGSNIITLTNNSVEDLLHDLETFNNNSNFGQ